MSLSRRRPTCVRLRKLLPIIAVLIIGGVVAYFFPSGYYRKAGNALLMRLESKKTRAATGSARSLLENTIRDHLHQIEVPDSTVDYRFFPADSVLEIHAAIPMGKPMAVVVHGFSGAAAGTPYHVDDCFCPTDEHQCTIRFVSSVPGQTAVVLTITHASRFLSSAAKMAIVITGITAVAGDIRDGLLSLHAPLTIALLPAPASTVQAKRIAAEHKEVLLLLPMESSTQMRDDFRNLRLMIHYPDAKLRSLMHCSMTMVPRFAGFSNLGGSRALEDSRVMTIVFSEMNKQHAYFLERAATHNSVAATLAEQLAMPYAAIDGIIDSADDSICRGAARTLSTTKIRSTQVSAARELLIRYALDARKRGKIIIAAQASGALLRALRRELPSFEHSGIKLSFVSRLFDTTGEPR